MIRELVRRSCGHLEPVSIFRDTGRWIDREIRKRETELCGVCLRRRAFSDNRDEEERENRPPDRSFSHEVEGILNERKSSTMNHNEGGST
ncbi:hypothetical protein ACSYAY_00945 [Leptospirillum ferriphilum]|uniref:Uncharacterized protein n=1 Tax=Leptospirillum ferriphilum TaxID=178606 RepID=A0A1V3SWG0_9BACT|nr:hypothetical protein [Leptospirillum ferriphilum]OOH72827.1 hypothetical protein BOX24_05410 [Leptospirillum ferriphilum]